MEITILVSEPWDFCSSDGENIIKVIKVLNVEGGGVYKSVSVYDGMSKYLFLQKRDEYGNYNIYAINDYEVVDYKKMKLAMIGKMN